MQFCMFLAPKVWAEWAELWAETYDRTQLCPQFIMYKVTL